MPRARLTLCALVAALALAACGGSGSHAPRHAPRPPRPPHAQTIPVVPPAPGSAGDTLTVHPGRPGRTIPPGFVGLSFEYWDLPKYVGTNPSAVDPVFTHLVENLAPSQRPSVRIGGVSSDHIWYPSPGATAPPWVQFTLTKSWLAIARAFTRATNAQLILGVNFEADSASIAANTARALVDGIGSQSIAGLELGNEPELYAGFPWYRTTTNIRVRGRSKATWTPALFAGQYAAIAHALPPVPVAGPATGSFRWIGQLGPILQANPELKLATIHAYPLKRCRATTHVTAAELLSQTSSVGLANLLAPAAQTAQRAHVPIRIGEFNSVSCGGQPGLSDTFAAALWSVDALFALANVGFDGVNFHSTPVVTNHLFNVQQSGGRWVGTVYPIYYGLQLFAQAAPPGARLEPVTGRPGSTIRAWATRAADGTTRVVLINMAASGTRTLTVRLKGATGTATVERLTAPGGVGAKTGVTLGGRSYGSSTSTGILAGTPTSTPTAGVDGRYRVTLPAASAALLTISRTG
jgi:hypothetical protein